jgi:hypothetical protein
MSKDWRTIFRFAVLGLVIATVFFGLSEMDPAPGSFVALALGGATLLLCPGSLLFVLAIDIEPKTTGFAIMWLIIGLINFAVYAAIGAAYIGLRKKRDGSVTN